MQYRIFNFHETIFVQHCITSDFIDFSFICVVTVRGVKFYFGECVLKICNGLQMT